MEKEQFGSFVAELRKEKDWTQKDLAEKLHVSDKAVSKWERGLSLPDVSLLMPLAEALGVSVTELLEGKRTENPQPKSAQQVEELVKKALSLKKEENAMTGEKKKRIGMFAAALVIVVLEWVITGGIRYEALNVLEGLSIGFGFYFWLLVQESLPDYYDRNPIGSYSHGPVRMNIPGVKLNNNNWPHIVKAVRIWTMTTMLTVPLAAAVLKREALQLTAMAAYLAALVYSLYRTGKKYE